MNACQSSLSKLRHPRQKTPSFQQPSAYASVSIFWTDWFSSEQRLHWANDKPMIANSSTRIGIMTAGNTTWITQPLVQSSFADTLEVIYTSYQQLSSVRTDTSGETAQGAWGEEAPGFAHCLWRYVAGSIRKLEGRLRTEEGSCRKG